MRVVAIILLFFCSIQQSSSQVTYLSGSYSVATATGSGAGGVPSLSYTATAGTDRLLLFFIVLERDHMPAPRGDNWGSNGPTGGSAPTVEISTTTLSHINSQWNYIYSGAASETNAEISIEMMVFGTLEANIPTGTNAFTITADFNDPVSSGDDAIFGALMFENVAGMSNITNSDCSSCNSISTSAVTPNDGNNAIFSIAVASSDRTFTAGANQTLLGSSSVSNSNGTYTDASYSEQDGVSVGTQYRTGTILSSTSDFSISGSANTFGMVESAYRIISPTLLPVDLIRFEVNNSEEGNVLEWTTASEHQNSHFEIERSHDGFTWEKLQDVQGNGDSSDEINYIFVDANYNCSTCYYRLKQVDFDSNFDYSTTRVLKTNLESSLIIFPMQSDSKFNIQSKELISSVEMYSMDGKIVFEDERLTTKNYVIYPNDLKKGWYMIKTVTAGKIFYDKVFKY